MTRMMLDGSRGSLDGSKLRKDNRRETWCPGAGAVQMPGLCPSRSISERSCACTQALGVHYDGHVLLPASSVLALLLDCPAPAPPPWLQPTASGRCCQTLGSCWRRRRAAARPWRAASPRAARRSRRGGPRAAPPPPPRRRTKCRRKVGGAGKRAVLLPIIKGLSAQRMTMICAGNAKKAWHREQVPHTPLAHSPSEQPPPNPFLAPAEEDDEDDVFELDPSMLPPRPSSVMGGDVATLQVG